MALPRFENIPNPVEHSGGTIGQATLSLLVVAYEVLHDGHHLRDMLNAVDCTLLPRNSNRQRFCHRALYIFAMTIFAEDQEDSQWIGFCYI